MTDAVELTEDEVDQLGKELSNWGKWGDDDELGTLNYIDAEKVRQIVGGLRGRTITIGREIQTVPAPNYRRPARHTMVYMQHNSLESADEITLPCHGVSITHLDALGHIYYNGMLYNGRSAEEYVQRDGLHFSSSMAQRDGIATRGVLLDVARARGVDWLEPGEGVTEADLAAAEELAGVKVGRGDAVLVRVGLYAREAVEGPEDPKIRAGILPQTMRWLHEREVAVLGGDCADKQPSGYKTFRWPMHILALACMGLPLLHACDMERLAAACAEEGRSDFLLTLAPLVFPKTTGCPVNPVCIF